MPSVPEGSESVVIVSDDEEFTVSEKSFASYADNVSALAVKTNVPDCAGIPEIVPVEASSDNPEGSALTADQVTASDSPALVMRVYEYAVPSVAAGSGEGVVIFSTDSTVSVKSLCAEKFPLTAEILNVNVPYSVGVPDIVPAD